MKKLALAPAIALAITGLAAAPVIAAPTAERSASVAPATAPSAASAAEEGQVDAAAAEFSISPTSISLADYADPEKGVAYTGTGLEPGSTYTIVDTPASGQAVEPFEDTITVDETGAFVFNIYGADDEVFLGTYLGEIQDSEGNVVASAEYEVTASGDEDPVEEEASLQLSADSISVSELKENGLPFTGEGFTGEIAVAAAGSPESEEAFYVDDNIEVAEDGTISGVITLTETDDIAPGEYVLWASDESGFAEVAFTVTADETEAPAEASLTVSPKKIEAADFVNEKKGVTLAVENCEPGSEVNFRVNPKGINVTAYESTEVAGEDGSASVLVFGTSADAEAYIGDYDVTVTCGDNTLTGAFSVTDGAKSGGNDDGKDDKGNGGDKGELPKTGAELTGLTAGAALLLIGGAAVALTTRRKKVAQSPSDF